MKLVYPSSLSNPSFLHPSTFPCTKSIPIICLIPTFLTLLHLAFLTTVSNVLILDTWNLLLNFENHCPISALLSASQHQSSLLFVIWKDLSIWVVTHLHLHYTAISFLTLPSSFVFWESISQVFIFSTFNWLASVLTFKSSSSSVHKLKLKLFLFPPQSFWFSFG